jgi:hypothetical protein
VYVSLKTHKSGWRLGIRTETTESKVDTNFQQTRGSAASKSSAGKNETRGEGGTCLIPPRNHTPMSKPLTSLSRSKFFLIHKWESWSQETKKPRTYKPSAFL